jgi:hypothetical protein
MAGDKNKKFPPREQQDIDAAYCNFTELTAVSRNPDNTWRVWMRNNEVLVPQDRWIYVYCRDTGGPWRCLYEALYTKDGFSAVPDKKVLAADENSRVDPVPLKTDYLWLPFGIPTGQAGGKSQRNYFFLSSAFRFQLTTLQQLLKGPPEGVPAVDLATGPYLYSLEDSGKKYWTLGAINPFVVAEGLVNAYHNRCNEFNDEFSILGPEKPDKKKKLAKLSIAAMVRVIIKRYPEMKEELQPPQSEPKLYEDFVKQSMKAYQARYKAREDAFDLVTAWYKTAIYQLFYDDYTYPAPGIQGAAKATFLDKLYVSTQNMAFISARACESESGASFFIGLLDANHIFVSRFVILSDIQPWEDVFRKAFDLLRYSIDNLKLLLMTRRWRLPGGGGIDSVEFTQVIYRINKAWGQPDIIKIVTIEKNISIRGSAPKLVKANSVRWEPGRLLEVLNKSHLGLQMGLEALNILCDIYNVYDKLNNDWASWHGKLFEAANLVGDLTDFMTVWRDVLVRFKVMRAMPKMWDAFPIVGSTLDMLCAGHSMYEALDAGDTGQYLAQSVALVGTAILTCAAIESFMAGSAATGVVTAGGATVAGVSVLSGPLGWANLIGLALFWTGTFAAAVLKKDPKDDLSEFLRYCSFGRSFGSGVDVRPWSADRLPFMRWMSGDEITGMELQVRSFQYLHSQIDYDENGWDHVFSVKIRCEFPLSQMRFHVHFTAIYNDPDKSGGMLTHKYDAVADVGADRFYKEGGGEGYGAFLDSKRTIVVYYAYADDDKAWIPAKLKLEALEDHKKKCDIDMRENVLHHIWATTTSNDKRKRFMKLFQKLTCTVSVEVMGNECVYYKEVELYSD